MKAEFLFPLEQARGEVLLQDLFDKNGNLILTKNTVLNDYIVEKLKSINIEKVPVYPSYKDGIGIDKINFTSLYKESVISMKRLMLDLISGDGANHHKLREIVNRLYEENSKKRKLLKSIGKIKDEYTYNHSVNVSLYSMYIAQILGFNEEQVKDVMQAGLLHDIGKSKIPKSIINKKGKLTNSEFEIVKAHATIGYNMSKNISFLKEDVRQAILTHHEREDGSGYPLGLKSKETNIYAKILAIADVYDALTSERVYKEKVTPFEAIEEFYKMGVDQFNKPILSAFFKNIVQCYVNSKIRLNDGAIGEIAYIPPNNITKPVIDIEGYYIDLEKSFFLQIVEVI